MVSELWTLHQRRWQKSFPCFHGPSQMVQVNSLLYFTERDVELIYSSCVFPVTTKSILHAKLDIKIAMEKSQGWRYRSGIPLEHARARTALVFWQTASINRFGTTSWQEYWTKRETSILSTFSKLLGLSVAKWMGLVARVSEIDRSRCVHRNKDY